MAANQDDIAFRSQEYASQVNRDVEPARQRLHNAQQGFVQSAATGMEMVRQGRQDAARNAAIQRELDQRQQQIAMEKTRDAGALALQQTRQKQAEYELFFTQQIHNTKAIEAQRRLITTQADIADLQKQKLQKDLAGDMPRGVGADEMAFMIATRGQKLNQRTGEWIDATPEELKAAKDLSMQKMEMERMKQELATLRAERVAMIGAGSRERVAEIGAGSREKVAETGAESRQKVAEVGAGSREKVAEIGAGSREKIAAEKLPPEKARARIKLIQTRLQTLKTRTDPEAEKERAQLNADMEQLDRELRGETTQGPQADMSAMDKAIERFLQTRPGGR